MLWNKRFVWRYVRCVQSWWNHSFVCWFTCVCVCDVRVCDFASFFHFLFCFIVVMSSFIVYDYACVYVHGCACAQCSSGDHTQSALLIYIYTLIPCVVHTYATMTSKPKKKQIRPLMVDAVCAVFAIMARLHKWYSRHIYLYVVGCCVLSCVCVFNVIPICLISMLLFSLLLLLLLFLFNDNKRVCE